MTNEFGQRFDLFRKTLKAKYRIKTKELAEALGVSPSYLTDLAKGRIREGGLRLWDGIRRMYSEWEPYLRGTVDEPPSTLRALNEAYPPIASSEAASSEIAEERRVFNRVSGLSKEEAQDLAAWLARNPEMKDLVVAWARARVKGTLSGREVDLFEVRVKAEAKYWLESVPKEADAKGG